MYNIALSLLIAAATFTVSALGLSWISAIVPALLTGTIAMFVLSRRTMKQVEVELAAVGPMLQEQKVAEAQAHLEAVKQKYGRWQILLSGQMDAQLGMIDYLQLKFDDALPKLIRGKFRNWSALVCIGCIHWRKGRKTEAYKAFEKAGNAAPKEAMLYLVWSTLLVKDSKRAEALEVMDTALLALPDSGLLKNQKGTIANKKKINTKSFPQTWYQFFPEEMAQKMMMRGRRGGPLPGEPQVPVQRHGARRAPRR